MKQIALLLLTVTLCPLTIPPVPSKGATTATATSERRALRIALAVIATLVALACVITTVYFALTVSIDQGIHALPFNDVSSKSIDFRFDLAEKLFQLSLLMMGALWGLLIAKKDEIRIVFAEKAEFVMFACASTTLLLSASCYAIYLNKISNQFLFAVRAAAKSAIELPLTVPDIFDHNVNYLFVLQTVSLIAGVFDGVLTLVSTHKLRSSNEK